MLLCSEVAQFVKLSADVQSDQSREQRAQRFLAFLS